MANRLNWEAAKRRDLVKVKGGTPSEPLNAPNGKSRKRSKKAITHAQRKYITGLARRCGVEARFPGTTGAASYEITRLRALVDEAKRAPKDRGS